MTILGFKPTGPQPTAPPHTVILHIVINAIDTAIRVFPKRIQVHDDAHCAWYVNYCDLNVLVNNIKLILYRIWTTEATAVKKGHECLMPK